MVSQWIEKGFNWSMASLLMSTFGCLFIFLFAWIKKQYSYKSSDWIYFLIGMICLTIYLFSKDALVTTIVAVIADFVLGIPMLIKAYNSEQRTFVLKLRHLNDDTDSLIVDEVISLSEFYVDDIETDVSSSIDEILIDNSSY